MFTIDYWPFLVIALGCVTALALWQKKKKIFTPSHIRFSSFSLFPSQSPTQNLSLAKLPRACQFVSLGILLFAFLDPRWMQFPEEDALTPAAKKPYPREGVALYIALDQSGSMKEEMADSESETGYTSRIDVMKRLTSQFIEGRQSDFIGLVTFARTSRIQSPLTLDYPFLLRKLKDVQVVKDPKDDGTAIGYAIYKTASLIAATRSWMEESQEESPYEVKGAAILMITDGYPFPHPDDKGHRLRSMNLEDAAEFAKEKGVRLYLISIDPAIRQSEYAPYRRLMDLATKKTGGRFFAASDIGNLSAVWDEINQLEASYLPVELAQEKESMRTASLYPLLVGIAIALFLFSLLVDMVWIRRIP